MTGDLHVADDAEREALAHILSHSFGFPAEDVPSWFERAGRDNVRAFHDGAALAGGLLTVPMGQYFGGRPVPMTGVAGVGVAPELRGTGAATRMMRALVRGLHDDGVALSTLYPATVPLYQRAGYERAGARYVVSVEPHHLPTARDPELRAVPLASVGEGATRELHARQSRTRDGSLDRGPYLWARINKPYKGVPRLVGVEGSEGLEGYLAVIHRAGEGGHETEAVVTDAVAVTPRATRELLALLGGYRSLASTVRWSAAPHWPLVQRLRERRHDVKIADFWMLRLVHVPRALEARGYNPTVHGAVTFTVTDEVVPENAGAWRLEVADGRGWATRVEGGGVALDVRALAALYTGFRSATALAEEGLAEGSAGDLATADALFAGPAPAMADAF